MSVPAFVEVCRDPALIKGIYNTCDQWCMYCPATERRSAPGDVQVAWLRVDDALFLDLKILDE